MQFNQDINHMNDTPAKRPTPLSGEIMTSSGGRQILVRDAPPSTAELRAEIERLRGLLEASETARLDLEQEVRRLWS